MNGCGSLTNDLCVTQECANCGPVVFLVQPNAFEEMTRVSHRMGVLGFKSHFICVKSHLI